ncbi:MAG: single-stranded-DNA-specific exonuclease RecJ [Planctomycetota bacterium]|nr:single-stranded-DNA-specific exonuclease RecJ [Planctomycetota bacterium]MDW8372705.1 single-stranded-DNA-specific exonuclease RecJ [Planctomycetota bacterium]
MLRRTRAWQPEPVLGDVVRELEHELGVSRLVATLLSQRGITSAAQATSWLQKRLGDLHAPQAMADMPRAAHCLAEAIAQRRRILIHGDYDVDGTTAAALLARFCRACAHDAVIWIPHRRIDGYGLSEASLEAARAQGAQLVVTVDCGISDHGWAQRIEEALGCPVLVTDHHLPSGERPRCTAVVNPNRPDCPYPDKHLAGVGVAWKLAWATASELCGSERVSERLRDFLIDALALVALGTIADCAPLIGENRILVHHGLKQLARTADPGLRALLAHCDLQGVEPTSGDVSWRLAPLLNASGRMDSAMNTIALLTARDAAAAQAALARVVAENDERRRVTQQLSEDLLARAEHDPQLATRAALVYAGEGWHPGVIGIVASRLLERFARPTAVIAIDGGVAKGSLRSVPAVPLGEALAACRPWLSSGGGHALAAGITLAPEAIPGFAAAFERHVAARLPPGTLVPRTCYDAEAHIHELDEAFFNFVGQMPPFGIGNREPVLRLRQAICAGRPRFVGREGEHVTTAITDGGGGLRQLWVWNGARIFADLAYPGRRFDLLVRPERRPGREQWLHRLIFVDGTVL